MMIFFQNSASAEPILIGGAVTGVGGVAVWAVATLISVRDNVRDLHHAMFGHPDSKNDSGMVATVDNLKERVNTVEWHINNVVGRVPPSGD